MTREQIEHLAREAGFWGAGLWTDANAQKFERFAALVAAQERERIVSALEDDSRCRIAGAPYIVRKLAAEGGAGEQPKPCGKKLFDRWHYCGQQEMGEALMYCVNCAPTFGAQGYELAAEGGAGEQP